MLFRLREYDEAFRDVFGRVIRLRAEEAYPLLREIPTEPRSAIHTSQVTLPSGEALRNEPFKTNVAFRFNLSDIVSGNIAAFTASAEDSGREYGEQTMHQLLKYSGMISSARRQIVRQRLPRRHQLRAGYTNVGDFAGTFAFGIRNRLELFGSFLFDTRIDRDIRPLFVDDPDFGGLIDRYPRVNTGWTGDHVGDLYLGAQINFWSEARQNPAAFALRWTVKVPTGDEEAGVSTGGVDVLIDAISSKEAANIDLAGYAGYEFRNNPDGLDIPTGAFRWGGGAAFPARSPLRIVAELNGIVPSSDTASITTATFSGTDGSLPPITSNTENLTRATVGVTFRAPKGFFVGTGLSWTGPQRSGAISRTILHVTSISRH